MTRKELEAVCLSAKAAQHRLLSLQTRNAILLGAARLLLERTEFILSQNRLDTEEAEKAGASPAFIDRLSLSEERINGIVSAIKEVALMPDPLSRGSCYEHKNGMKISRVSVPLGLVAMVFESRPNVAADAAALCLKSGNSVLLRGGSEARRSVSAIAEAFRDAAAEAGVPREAVSVLDDGKRETAALLPAMRGFIDLLVPRGGKGLIRAMIENATVPVIETGAGNCHVYFEKTADEAVAADIIFNAKTSRPSVCNAAETLLCDACEAKRLLLPAAERLARKRVLLRACPQSHEILSEAGYPFLEHATEADWETEYGDYILAVKLVDGEDEAIAHINRYSTGHSEAIVTQSMAAADAFEKGVDSAAVYVNASTRFTDGGEFGLGAELGISTQKLHARGPFGLDALTTTQYRIRGNGQTRN